MGSYAVLIAVAGVVSIVSTLRLDQGVPLADSDEEAVRLALLCLTIVHATTIFCTTILLVAHLAGYHPSQWGIGYSIWLLPPSAWALGVWSSLRALHARWGNFSKIGSSAASTAAVQTLAQVGAGIAGIGAIGLSAGYALGRFTNVIWLWPKEALPRLRGHIRKTWRSASRFPRYNLAPALLNSATVTAIAPFAALLYGLAVAGYFTLATRVLAAPSTLLGISISGVFYPRIADALRRGEGVTEPVVRLLAVLLLAPLPAFGLITLFGPELFALVFGEQWVNAGTIAAILSPWLALNFASSVLSTFITAKGELRRLFYFAFAESAIRIAALATGMPFASSELGVAVYSGSGVAISTFYVFWALRLAEAPRRLYGGWTAGWAATVATLCVIAATRLIVSDWTYVIIGSGVWLGICIICLSRVLPLLRGKSLLDLHHQSYRTARSPDA